MQQYRKNLGKVSLTAEGKHSRDKAFDILSIVYDEHTKHGFISRKDVPEGVDLYNAEYWMPINVSGYSDNNIIILSEKTSENTIKSYTLEEAIKSIAEVGRKPGMMVGFYNENSDRMDIGGCWELWYYNGVDVADWENLNSWNCIYYNYNKFVGWYRTDEELKKYVPFPEIGCYAYVGSDLNEAVVYRCDRKYVWTNTTEHAWNYIKVIVGGNVTVGENGNWFNDGVDTNIPASIKGENGKTPAIRNNHNILEVSYDNLNWTPISDEIAAWFRWQGKGGQQVNSIGKIQITRDGATWIDLSGEFVNNLRISRYIGTSESLPTSGIAEGTIYAKGPYYEDTDTLQEYPSYRLWVYAWKGNTLAWIDNGEFQSIVAGIVQETGDGEGVVMSQKAVTEKLSELGSKVNTLGLEFKNKYEIGTDTTGYKNVIFESPINFISGKTYLIENLSSVGLSCKLYSDEDGTITQEIGNINPDVPIKFTASVDAKYIGGYGNGWKVRISLVSDIEDLIDKKVSQLKADVDGTISDLSNLTDANTSDIGSISLELDKSFNIGTDATGYKTEIFKCPFKFIQGKRYTVENISVSGKGISVNLYNELNEIVQSIGTVNPTSTAEFVAEQDAEYIGGYGSAWKVRISIANTLEEKAHKGAEAHSFVIGEVHQASYESEQGVYLNFNNGEKITSGSNTLAVSKPIPVVKGQLVVAELSTLYDFVSAIAVTNSEGTSHNMVVKGNGSGIEKYYYIADKDGYIEVCFDYRLDNKVYISDSSLSQLVIETILSNSNLFPSINIGVDGDSITAGNQWSYYAAQILGANQYNVGVGSACWSYKDKYALDGVTIISPQHYTDENFVGFGGASNLDSDEKIQMWVNNNACTHIEKFVALVADGTYPTPDMFVFAMGTNTDTKDGSIDEAMNATSINDEDFVNENGKSLKYSMCGAMRWCIETIKRAYPKCKVFVSLPIQRASYETNKTYLYPKVQLIKDMSIQMGCQIIDQYNGCGITSAIENDSSPYGPYLKDGLHPNTDGQKLMGAFAASQIKVKYFAV